MCVVIIKYFQWSPSAFSSLLSRPTKRDSTMNLTKSIAPVPLLSIKSTRFSPNTRWALCFRSSDSRFSLLPANSLLNHSPLIRSSITAVVSDVGSSVCGDSQKERLDGVEVQIEKVIYGCRFLAILAVWGSLIGSFLCFIKGCTHVVSSFQDYFIDRGRVIISLVEAIDVYLLGTVMLVFGMGLYELFISNLDKAKYLSDERSTYRSNLFGLFTLKERPRWLEIKTVNGLKTKVGHVIVMLLLIGLFEKSKRAVILSPVDLLCFSASVFLCSSCLYLLSKLND
ncbi:uncharacterized protein [Primulina eburnea]|uniref:uncharacterized protein n=1 Tax=Primulina eburnea TaxID=1245227 RepID=UPI003C6C81B0